MLVRHRKTILLGTGLLGTYWGWRTWRQWQLEKDKRLTPERYVALELIEKEQLTHDAFRLRLATERQSSPFPVLSCLYVKDDMIQVMRAYTPVNDPFKDGYVDLIVKRYENGSISRMLSKTALHDKIFVRGPMLEYDYQPNNYEEIGMIAGGTGITPMYQLARRVLENPDDKTRLWLIYGNKTEQDILLKKELEQLQEQYKDRFKIYHVLERPPNESWQGGQGYVTEEMVRSMVADHGQCRRLVLVCGPDAMLAHVSGRRARDFSQGPVRGILGRMGFKSNEVFKLE